MHLLEKEAIKRLYAFPGTISEAGRELSPAIIANYIFDLARGFNQFYQELPVLKEENPDKIRLRLTISAFTFSIIQKGMGLMGIEVPERM